MDPNRQPVDLAAGEGTVRCDAVDRQQKDRGDAAFLVEEVPYEEAGRYGVCDTNDSGEITDVVEKSERLVRGEDAEAGSNAVEAPAN